MEDLPLLVEHFLSLEEPRRAASDVPPHVWDLFRAYRWPGNVRELRNAVQRLLVTPDRLLQEPSPETSTPSQIELMPLRIARRNSIDAFERAYIAAALTKAGGNVTRAAALAEVSRQVLQKLLKKYGRPWE
jgi:DNA-binding NtrC family response regulator